MELDKVRELEDGTAVFEIRCSGIQVVAVELSRFLWYRALVNRLEGLGMNPASVKAKDSELG